MPPAPKAAPALACKTAFLDFLLIVLFLFLAPVGVGQRGEEENTAG